MLRAYGGLRSQGCLGHSVYLNPKTPPVSGSLDYDFLGQALHIRETPYKGDPS